MLMMMMMMMDIEHDIPVEMVRQVKAMELEVCCTLGK